jgi:ATP-dependent exoDNAse (exonuclease V) beta subunit
MKHSQDKRVVFNPKDHSYFKGDRRLISVTTFLSGFKNEFDSDYYSKRAAKKEGVTQKEILDRWDAKGLKSRTIGTAIHKIFEDYTNNEYTVMNGNIVFDDCLDNPEYYLEYLEKKKVSEKFIKDFFVSGRLTPIHSEYIVYNNKLSGQIDMICKDANNNFYILDFKTNEKIDTNHYGKFYKGELDFLPESTYNSYSLQLSIYKSMFKKHKIESIFLVHIEDYQYRFIECEDLIKRNNLEHLIL